MDGPASPGVVPPVAALREARLNGFPEALAQVRRHRIGGSRRRVPDAAPTGSLDALFVVEHTPVATLRASPAEAGGGLRPL